MSKRDPDDYRPIPRGAIRIDLPNATQTTDYTCGASALQSICSYFGVGPEDEWDFVADMKMPRSGSDPIHITRAATKYGLSVREYRPMTSADLVTCIDAGRPVILMLQAWADRRRRSYRSEWDEGHWVVAIGYDDDVFYFEDPSLHGSRGYITRAMLDERWHDIEGRAKHRTDHLGIALWLDDVGPLGHARAARRID